MLNLEDRDYFFSEILPRQSPKPKRATITRARDSHKRMQKAAKIAEEFIDALTKLDNPADADARLNNWLNYIDSALYIIWVQVLDERTAFTIFETMNDRGLKLSAADLLKNFLHATANDQQEREEVMHKWGSMTSVLETVEGEEENVVEYMRCFWVTRYGQTRTRYLYDRIKEKTTNKAKAMALVRDLESTVQNYAAIIMPSHERTIDRGEAVRSAIEALRILGVTQVRPAALSAFLKFDHSEFEKFIVRCVSWSVRFLVGSTASGTVEGYYAKIAMEIWNETILTAHGATTAIRQIVPKDEEFKVSFANARESKQKIARYYLHELQKACDGTCLSRELTLEHILPKDRLNGWTNFTPEEYKECVHRIGNLALLEETANGGISSAEYDVKKPVLSNPKNCSLTIETANYAVWGKKEIEARQSKLADIAIKAWPIG